MSRRSQLSVAMMTAILAVGSVRLEAQSLTGHGENKDTPELPKLQFRQVQVVDPEGKPVSGALVVDTRMIHFTKTFLVTDKDGFASVPVREDPSLPAESFSLMFSHPDFKTAYTDVPIGGQNAPPFMIKAKRGVDVTIRAVDTAGRPIIGVFGALVTGESAPTRWRLTGDGRLRCVSMPNGDAQILLVQPLFNGNRLFSDVLIQTFNLRNDNTVVFDDIELSPGVPIRGKLSNVVPRPIKNGIVIALQIPMPAGTPTERYLPSVEFYDQCEIEEDGSFGWESMPRTGKIQLIAFCDGWVGLNESKDVRTAGQTFEVEEKPLDVELEMLRTYEHSFVFVDENGNPVPGVQCGLSLSQQWLFGLKTNLGLSFDSMEIAMASVSEPPRVYDFDTTRFSRSGESNDQGKVTFRNVPPNQSSRKLFIWAPVQQEEKVPQPQRGEFKMEYKIVIKKSPTRKN